jgi:hypothetical protein
VRYHLRESFLLAAGSLLLFSSCGNSGTETTVEAKPAAAQPDPYLIEVPVEFPLNQLPVYPNVLDDKYQLGQGMKSGTYEIVGTAIETKDIKMASVIDSSKGGKTEVTYQYATDYTSLKQSMGLNISMNAKMGWFSASASMNQLQSTVQNSLSQFVVAKIFVSNLTQRIINPKLTDRARQLLKQDPATFYNNYGDRFISGMVTGGEINIVYEFLANSVVEKNDLAVSVKASYKGVTNSVSALVDYTKNVEQKNENQKVKVHIIRFGDKSDMPNDSLESMLKFIKTFPDKVNPISGDPDFLYFVTDRYITAANQDPLAEKQDSLELLSEKQRKIFQLLSWKQEQVTEALKISNFVLDSTLFTLTEDQHSKVTDGIKMLRNLFLDLDDCFTVCRNVNSCENCKKLVGAKIFNPDLTTFKMIRRPYEQVAEKSITNLDNLLYVLKPHARYKLIFQGTLMAGQLYFEPFISTDNERRAVEQGYPAYPLIRLTMTSNATSHHILLQAKDKEMFITTDENEISIYGRYGLYMLSTHTFGTYALVLRSGPGSDGVIMKVEQSDL